MRLNCIFCCYICSKNNNNNNLLTVEWLNHCGYIQKKKSVLLAYDKIKTKFYVSFFVYQYKNKNPNMGLKIPFA